MLLHLQNTTSKDLLTTAAQACKDVLRNCLPLGRNRAEAPLLLPGHAEDFRALLHHMVRPLPPSSGS